MSETSAEQSGLLISRLLASMATVVRGKPEVIRQAVCAFLSGGHLLIEDVPGVGKTSLARALAQASGCEWNRIQFTPDLLPADLTGTTIFNQSTNEFTFRPGPLFTNIVLADEINRSSPKTQSALLEAMGERAVSYDGRTYELSQPYLVVATQNPVDYEGTFPLPESELDRFMMRLTMGYPARDAEIEMLGSHAVENPVAQPVMGATQANALIAQAASVFIAPSLQGYIVDLIALTRTEATVTLGASPRASIALQAAARAWALMDGRDFVLPDDIQALAVPVLAHRIVLTGDIGTTGPETIVGLAIERTPVPSTRA